MTTSDVFSALRRRWYITLLGVLVTLLAMLGVHSIAGVFWTQVDVVFEAPAAARQEGSLVSSSASLVAMAGLVERTVNHGKPAGAATATEVSMVGTGVRHGTLVLLPNSGGQWDYNFSSPVLSVQAAGSSVSEAQGRRDEAVRNIRTVLRDLQDASGIRASRRITTHLVPELPPVQYSNGHPTRALGVVAFLGLGATVLFSVLIDRWLLTRPDRRRPRARRHVHANAA